MKRFKFSGLYINEQSTPAIGKTAKFEQHWVCSARLRNVFVWHSVFHPVGGAPLIKKITRCFINRNLICTKTCGRGFSREAVLWREEFATETERRPAAPAGAHKPTDRLDPPPFAARQGVPPTGFGGVLCFCRWRAFAVGFSINSQVFIRRGVTPLVFKFSGLRCCCVKTCRKVA